MKILIGTPVHRQGAYVLDKFVANQKQIQQDYPSSELVFATDDTGFANELKNLIGRSGLRGTVISHQVEKPDYAKSRLWNIASGREAIRRYLLSQTEARALLFLDADMTFDPSVIRIMEKEIQGYDAVFSGYWLRTYGIGLAGAGCLMLTREALEKIKISCYEFKNGYTIPEDTLIEMDLYRRGGRIKKGYFLAIDHYFSSTEARHTPAQRVGTFRKITNHPLIRYYLIKASIILHFDITGRLFKLSSRIRERLNIK